MNRIPWFLFTTSCFVIIILIIGNDFTDGGRFVRRPLSRVQLWGAGSSSSKGKKSKSLKITSPFDPVESETSNSSKSNRRSTSLPNAKKENKERAASIKKSKSFPDIKEQEKNERAAALKEHHEALAMDKFREKMDQFRTQLPKPVRRKYIFTDTMAKLEKITSPNVLRKRLLIRFKGDKGIDSGGVSREFFFLLSRKIFNPKFGYFHYVSNKNRNLVINSCSVRTSLNHLKIFRVIGMISALAVYHGNELVAHFSIYFYKLLLGKEITLKDIKLEDPETYSAINTILKNDPKSLGFTFSVSEIINGSSVTYSLVPGGDTKKVTNANKELYAKQYIKVRYEKRIQRQMNAFLRGFHTLIPKKLITLFTEKELKYLLCGSTKIDVEEWKRYTYYRGYTDNSPTIKYFWQVVKEMSQGTKYQLLQFLTGTSRLPIGGFSNLEGVNGKELFTIQKAGTIKHYPVAHTCYNILDLPPYPTKIRLKRRLLTAMKMSAGKGFTVV